MARVNSRGLLKGSVANLSYRVLNGQGIVQSKPGKDQVAQTQATKNSASDFGKASYTARTIRNGLFTILQNMTDSKMYVRFTTKIYETALSATDLPKGQKRFADGDLSLMKNFEFNSNSLFAKYAVFKPQAILNALQQIEISVPAIAPKNEVLFPTEATDCELCFMVTAFDKNDYTLSYCDVFKATLPWTSQIVPAQEFITPALPENAIVFVCQSLFYYRQNSIIGTISLNSKEVHPVSVLGVFKTEGV